jgi:hypothetical protein
VINLAKKLVNLLRLELDAMAKIFFRVIEVPRNVKQGMVLALDMFFVSRQWQSPLVFPLQPSLVQPD